MKTKRTPQKYEFSIGDIIHFQNYKEREPIRAKVVGCVGGIFQNEKACYRLSGISAPLVSVTSGSSIIESSLFNLISEKDAFKD